FYFFATRRSSDRVVAAVGEHACLDPPDVTRADHLHAVPLTDLPHPVPHVLAVAAALVDVDFVADLAGVAGAAGHHVDAADLPAGQPAVLDVQDVLADQLQ